MRTACKTRTHTHTLTCGPPVRHTHTHTHTHARDFAASDTLETFRGRRNECLAGGAKRGLAQIAFLTARQAFPRKTSECMHWHVVACEQPQMAHCAFAVLPRPHPFLQATGPQYLPLCSHDHPQSRYCTSYRRDAAGGAALREGREHSRAWRDIRPAGPSRSARRSGWRDWSKVRAGALVMTPLHRRLCRRRLQRPSLCCSLVPAPARYLRRCLRA